MIEYKYKKNKKKIAYFFENIIVYIISRILGHAASGLMADNVKKIIIIRHNQLGDAFVSSPFIAAIHDNFPNAKIDVIASRQNSVGFEALPFINEIYILPKQKLARWRFFLKLRNKYDVVFQTLFDENFLHRSFQARFIAGKGFAVGRKRGTPLDKFFDVSVWLPVGSYVGKLMSLLTPLIKINSYLLVNKYPKLFLNKKKSKLLG